MGPGTFSKKINAAPNSPVNNITIRTCKYCPDLAFQKALRFNGRPFIQSDRKRAVNRGIRVESDLGPVKRQGLHGDLPGRASLDDLIKFSWPTE